MKLKTLIMSILAATAISSCAAQDITLPAPLKSGGNTLAEALSTRRSIREFNPDRDLTLQQVADLLWSAAGINRPDGHTTNPTAMNSQEIAVYLFDKNGVYQYDKQNNRLSRVAEGDHRPLVAGTKEFTQDFVLDAPVSLVMVADIDKFERGGDMRLVLGACDAGIVTENINLYCAANGLATVTRATMDQKGIVALLGLRESQIPLLNNPVGYAK